MADLIHLERIEEHDAAVLRLSLAVQTGAAVVDDLVPRSDGDAEGQDMLAWAAAHLKKDAAALRRLLNEVRRIAK